MSKESCEAAESAAGAALRMARAERSRQRELTSRANAIRTGRHLEQHI